MAGRRTSRARRRPRTPSTGYPVRAPGLPCGHPSRALPLSSPPGSPASGTGREHASPCTTSVCARRFRGGGICSKSVPARAVSSTVVSLFGRSGRARSCAPTPETGTWWAQGGDMTAHRGYRVLLCIAAALAVAGSAVTTGPAAAESKTSGVSWVDCGDGFQCAHVEVPLDYARPAATRIHVGLTKLPAKGGTGKGSVLVNAGTQAGGGGAYVRGSAAAFAEINRDFDVIGLDTRGVGVSDPLVHCTTFEENREIEAPLSAAQTVADRPTRVREATQLAAKCQERSGDLLPDRVAAMVLDSPLDPHQFINDAFGFDIDQMAATEHTMGTFFHWCQTTPALCAFGAGDPRSAFTRLLAKTRQNRLDNPGRWDIVTDGSLVDFISGAMLFPQLWPGVSQQLAAMAAQPLPTMPLPSGDDRGFAEYYSQTCLDRTFPTSLAAYDRQLRRSIQAAPILGGRYGYAEFKCRQWPAHAVERRTGSWLNPGKRPVLVLTATDDPLAPHRGSLRVAHRLQAGLVVLRSSGHLQLGRTACADSKVAEFLRTATAPRHTSCSVPLPGH